MSIPTQAPSWALTAEAIDGQGDPYLNGGVHLRALPSPKLGVPATPLVVTRHQIPGEMVKRYGRNDGVVWVDSFGNTLTAPFDITPDNPVIGYLPVKDVIWVELSATPADLGPILTPINPTIGPATVAAPSPTSTRITSTTLSTSTLTTDLSTRLTLTRKAALRLEWITGTGKGLAVLQTRRSAPWALAGWGINKVRVVGQGRVDGLRWLGFSAVSGRMAEDRGELVALWSLPLKEPTPRYQPTASALSDAKDRVHRAAVVHQPLYVDFGSAGAVSPLPADGNDAMARVSQVQPQLEKWLDKLLHDLSRPPHEVLDEHTINGKIDSHLGVPIEPFLLSAAVDPDVGHYLGFGDRDDKAQAVTGTLLLYRIRGAWRWNPKRWHPWLHPVFAPAIADKPDDLVQSFPELKEYGIAPQEDGPFVDLHSWAVALVGTPPAPLLPVKPDPTDDLGWLASPPPPNVRRRVGLHAHGFGPRALAAISATDPRGLRTLNQFPSRGRPIAGKPMPFGTPMPIIVTRPENAEAPGEFATDDRDAPQQQVDYRIAQADWFGRWSDWAAVSAPEKARTPPMRPTLELDAKPNEHIDEAALGDLLAATLYVRVPIPATVDLPPGGNALASLTLHESFQGQPMSTVSVPLAGAVIEPHPTNANDPVTHNILVIQRTGPLMPAASSRDIEYTATWVDVGGLESALSDPLKRKLIDPRPPAPPVVNTELRYSARPDSLGHARVSLDFPTENGVRYRVFGSSEPTLLKALENSGHAAIAQSIRQATAGAPRAMAFRAHQAKFGWDHFENLTPQPIVGNGSTQVFVDRLSGGQEVLAFYRVLAEGPQGGLSEITASELVPFAVPNLGAPSQPVVSRTDADKDPLVHGVTLQVKVPRGKAVPKAWRLRRTRTPVRDPLRMEVLAEGPVQNPQVDREGTIFSIDGGTGLQAWRVYQFAVQVQADAPPGAPLVGTVPPGEWSDASAPVQVTVVPTTPPNAPTAVALQAVAGGLQLTVSHPQAAMLGATPMGAFRWEVWRIDPGKRPVKKTLAFERTAGNQWLAVDSGPVEAKTYVSVSVIDPLGRASPPTLSAQL